MTARQNHFDVIVVGLGGVGSATVASLAQAGHRVLGIDQFDPPHNRGSSHGQTRIIRKAYFEHPNYVPLLHLAYSRWQELEQSVGRQLYFQTGLLQIGPAEGEVLSGVQRSATEHKLDIESMSIASALKRFPGIAGDPNWTAILEPNAGYLLVEDCVAANLEVARRYSAELVLNSPVLSWQASDDGVGIQTANSFFQAERLVISAGPWADKCLQAARLPLQVIRKHVYWYAVRKGSYNESDFPCFFFDTPQGFFYGMPDRAGQGLKVGRHSGGHSADPDQSPIHPKDIEDQQLVENFLSNYLTDIDLENQLNWSGCYYTMTPDQHFILDRLPRHPNVIVVAGLSGHGFKFTNVLGEIAACLASDTNPPIDASFLSLERFQRQ